MTHIDPSSAVSDRLAIADLIYRYCRSVDRLDVALGHSIWHDDGIADYGSIYQGSGKGVIDLICAQHRQTLHHSHQVTNILIELAGDRATSESYVTANLRIQQGPQLRQISVWGRYIDSWSRREDRWGLDKRIAIRDFDEMRDVVEMSRYDIGKREPSDPSYKVFAARS